MFLRDFWYAVAWDHEIKHAPFPRTICREPIAFYRQTSGALCVFEDSCPHRLLPLSKGYLKGNHLVCKYHGLEFDHCGACLWMPGQQGVHREAKIPCHPVAERHRLIWVWIGRPELADETKIPDLHWSSDPKWIFEGGTYKETVQKALPASSWT